VLISDASPASPSACEEQVSAGGCQTLKV
jgi:hypothetical protein